MLGDARAVRDGVVESMAATMVHRGPDASGVLRSGRGALGHRRLSIIDLSDDAAQPMFNEDRTVALVFNGEIYNFCDLRTELEARGHRFRSHGDGEVILHLFEEYGTGCVEHLEGMFAFAVYDLTAERLFLARDRIGEKPLHYAVVGDEFYFASEIKALFASGRVAKQLSAGGIAAYFNYVQIPAPATIFEGIHKLPAAHWMVVDSQGVGEPRPYWHLDYCAKIEVSTEQAVDRLHALMIDAVEKMLVSDVPLGIMLSGGVDSTLILALARELGARNIETFTVGNLVGGEPDDECRRAQKMAARFGAKNHVFDFGGPEFSEMWDAAGQCDEPLGLLEIFYHFGVFRRLKPYAKVVLTGNGADELFGGYTTYLPIGRLSAALAWTSPLVGQVNGWVNTLAAHFYTRRNSDALEPYWHAASPQARADSSALLTRSMTLARYDNLLDAKLFADLSVLCNHALSAIPDTAGMVNSVELRSPFLHIPVVEFAASLPSSFKVRPRDGVQYNKAIVKLLLARFIDPEDVYARKYGFGYFISVIELMRTTWRQPVETLIVDPALEALGIFKLQGVRDVWQRLLAGRLGMRERLVFARYVMFAFWYKQAFPTA